MKPISPIIILTAVVLALVSPVKSFAQADEDDDKLENCGTYEKMFTDAQSALNASNAESTRDPKHDKLQRAYDEAKVKYDNCRTKRTEAKKDLDAKCKEWHKELKEITKDFPPSLNAAAQSCLNAYEDDEGSMGTAVLYAWVGQSNQGESSCDLGGAKTINKDKINDITKEIDKLESGVRKTDDNIIKEQETYQKVLQDIEKQRDQAKERYEEQKEEAENAQVKALSDLRNQQTQLAKSIRELRTQELVERQQIANIQSRLKFAMSFAKPLGNEKGGTINLRSEVSILNYCKKEAAASVGTGKSANGAARAQSARDQINTCVEGLREQRKNTETASQQELEQRNNRLSEIHEQINSSIQQLDQLTQNYNDAAKRLYEKMNAAQQKYFKADSDLANRANTVAQTAQQKQSQLQTQKMQDQMKIMGKYNSQGRLSNRDAEEIIGKAEEISKYEGYLKDKNNKCGSLADFKPYSDQVKVIQEKEEDRGGNNR